MSGMSNNTPLFNTIPLNGPLFVGTIINWLLLGVQLHQVFDYAKNYQRDTVPLKLLVYGLLALDIAQTGLSTRFSWVYLVEDWGNYGVFIDAKPTWTGPTMPVMAGLVAIIVQFYYAWRIWFLGGSRVKFGAAFIALVSIMQFFAALISSVKYELEGSTIVSPSLVPGFTIWLVSSFVCDTVIAACMLIICHKAKVQTSFTSTSAILNQITRNVVETAAVTAFCAGGQLVCFLAYRNTSLSYLTPAFLLGKLYSNCLMANLNGRKSLRQSEGGHNSGGLNSDNSVHMRDVNVPQSPKSRSAIASVSFPKAGHDSHLDYSTKGDSEDNQKKSRLASTLEGLTV